MSDTGNVDPEGTRTSSDQFSLITSELDRFDKLNFTIPSGVKSIHNNSSIDFYSSIFKQDPWVLNVLRNGLTFDFLSLPSHYQENNNMSALKHMSILREQIFNWENVGSVQRVDVKPLCINPMSVVTQVKDDKIKYRPVIDLSRYLNDLISPQTCSLDDLSYSESWIDRNDWMCALDLSCMYHHVKLHPSMWQYFGFQIVDENGEEIYFVFTVLMFGVKTAVYIVTRLLKPLKIYLHSLAIRFSCYIDDSRIIAKSPELASFQIKFVKRCFELLGWNVNEAKSEMTPTQNLFYLGFYTNTVEMKYYSAHWKLNEIVADISSTVDRAKSNGLSLSCKSLAKVLGRIASLKRSHGNIVNVMTRASQHVLGKAVFHYGWDSSCVLTSDAIFELLYLRNNLFQFNGHPIFESLTPVKIFSHQDVDYYSSQVAKPADFAIFCSDASDSNAFVFEAEKFQVVEDFIFSPTERKLGSGHRELLAVIKALESSAVELKIRQHSLVYWLTDSKNCHSFILRGSRHRHIQTVVLRLKCLELKLCTKIVPVWVPRTDKLLVLADIGSKLGNSTDEWGIDSRTYQYICRYFNVIPTIDCFATSINTKCTQFFSKVPQIDCLAVNFFAQSLSKENIYYICPPVDLIIPVLKHIEHFPGAKGILLVPIWKSAAFWPFLVLRDYFRASIVGSLIVNPSYQAYNEAQHIFKGVKKFKMLALIFNSSNNKIITKSPFS